MRNIPSARLLTATLVLGLLMFCFGQPGWAQTPLPLSLDNNYMVTGDYVVGGWTKTGPAPQPYTQMSMGTIPIPDATAYGGPNKEQKVPAGADIVAAFLYWGTVENSGVHSGQNGFFGANGQLYPITGAPLGNPKAPVSWSSGGCAGGSGSKTMVTYRAEVSALLPVDANGNTLPNNPSYQLYLPDTGKPSTPPFAMGATLVIIYRLLVPGVPLNAVIIYDGAYAPSNTALTMTQPMIGFYQAGNDQPAPAPIVTKLTHIVGNGQSNKLQQVFLNYYDALGNLKHSTMLPSLYGSNPPFPGNNYNTPWDNPTWFVNDPNYTTTPSGPGAVRVYESSESAVVVPNSSNKGCVSWGAVIFSTTVQDTDGDGLLDVWKTNQGYCDPGVNRGMSNQGICPSLGTNDHTNDPSWVSLSGAAQGQQDVFIQLDYMCTKFIANTTTCDPSGVSYKPDPNAISNLMNAFSLNGHSIHVHIVPNDNNPILAPTCSDNTLVSPPIYCPHPGQAGVVDWKLGYTALKTQPLNYPDETTCEQAGPLCNRRFPPGQNNSYHEAIFAVASATPNWFFQDGSLTSISASGNTLTFTTSAAHGLAPDPTDTGIPNGRITVYGAISSPSLNGTYLVQSVGTDPNTHQPFFTIQLATATAAPTKVTDPYLSVTSGVVNTGSGVSDIGGADSLISLGLWGADGQTVPVESGTFMHELGHSLGLAHGGLYRTNLGGGDYSFSFEPNCKPNHQSVMNYMFQVDLLDGALDYSEQALTTLDESQPSPANVLTSAIHPTLRWYAPNQTIGTPATAHCDGSPLAGDPPTFRLQGPANSITWAMNQDINFDGKIEDALQGYDDWTNILLDQVGATGNDLWAAGVPAVKTIGGVPAVKTIGGVPAVKTIGGVPAVKTIGGEAKLKDVSSFVRNPTANPQLTLTPANTVQVTFTAPDFGQSQIDHFNVYRSFNGAPFSKPSYGTVPVAGMTLPLPNPLTFTDTKASCGTFSYFVTTVLSDGRESVPSNPTDPITVPCIFIGFLSPLTTASQAPALPTFSGPRKLGNALPIKWELVDASGNPDGDLSTLRSAQACPTTGSTVPPASSAVPSCVLIYSPTTGAKGSTTFRYSSPSFIINWDTGSLSGLGPGYWTIEVQLSDGRIEWTTVLFQ